MTLQPGDSAPDFTLPSQSGEEIRLSDLWGGRHVVLYFYPKDFTPGCTAEACAFRDEHSEFRELDAQVIGISSDTVRSHREFAEKFELPYPLLADHEGEIRAMYGVGNSLGVIPGRVTFLIDSDGIIRHVFSSQRKIKRHVVGALEELKRNRLESHWKPQSNTEEGS